MQSPIPARTRLGHRAGVLFLFLFMGFMVACQDKAPTGAAATLMGNKTALQVYKDAECHCCQDWVEHMREAGFEINVRDTANTTAVKQTLGINPELYSCHTAVTAEADYYFEGHVPGKLVRAFLKSPPAGAVGLAVPGMPIGSPGMEMGADFRPYNVVVVMEDGTTAVYASINTAAEQYD